MIGDTTRADMLSAYAENSAGMISALFEKSTPFGNVVRTYMLLEKFMNRIQRQGMRATDEYVDHTQEEVV